MFAFAKSLPVFTGPMPRVWRSAISSSRRVSTESSERWDMFAAICVERPPLVAPKLNILEQSVKEALEQYELARSLKSDHEMRLIRDQ